VKQKAKFEAVIMLAKAEEIVPTPESAHAIRAAIDEALDAKTKGEKRVILFNLRDMATLTWRHTNPISAGNLKITSTLPRR
jgi:tryptophan synthase beta chain